MPESDTHTQIKRLQAMVYSLRKLLNDCCRKYEREIKELRTELDTVKAGGLSYDNVDKFYSESADQYM